MKKINNTVVRLVRNNKLFPSVERFPGQWPDSIRQRFFLGWEPTEEVVYDILFEGIPTIIIRNVNKLLKNNLLLKENMSIIIPDSTHPGKDVGEWGSRSVGVDKFPRDRVLLRKDPGPLPPCNLLM